MKLQIESKELQQGLKKVGYTVSKGATNHVLDGVRIKGKEDSITLYTTNLEQGLLVYIAGQVVEDGTAVVPYKILNEIVKKMKGNIVLQDSKEEINTGSSYTRVEYKLQVNNSKLVGYDPDEFPAHAAMDEGDLNFHGVLNHRAIEKCIHATSLDEARPILQGVYITNYITCTDGFRIAKHPQYCQNEGLKCIIPASALKTYLKLSKEDAHITANASHIQITIDNNTILYTIPIDGNYPDADAVINDSIKRGCTYKITMNKWELKEALETVGIIHKGKYAANDTKFDYKDGNLILSCNEDNNKLEAIVACDMKGIPFSFALNYKFVLECITSLNNDTITLELNAHNTPVVIREGDYIEIIMPMHMG